jgi:CRISPR/Cas system-associated exonuclease Cas4 (RecB family)
MLMNRKYNYDQLERVTHDDGTRYYVSPQNEHLSSVTTILSATSENEGLKAWRDWVGEQEADRIKTEATGLGSLMHTHLENYVSGVERPGGSNLVRVLAKNMADQVINRGLINVDEVWGMEEILYLPSCYAGTSDLIMIHKGDETIGDYKTTRKMKSKSFITDYSLQTAAYAIAHDEMYGTKIKKGVIFMVDRDLKFEEYIWEGNAFETAKDQWLFRLEKFLNMNA